MKKQLHNVKKGILKNKYANLFRPGLSYPENKFLIYTRGRTGSTLLTDLLNCHDEIFCDVEIFNFLYSKSRVRFPIPYINSCSKRAAIRNKSVYGFKVKIAQLRYEHKYKNYDDILLRLRDNGWKFIYLRRENYLRHKLSNLLITATNIYHKKNGDSPEQKKIHVDCNVLMEGIQYSEEVNKTEEENLKSIPHITVVYEKDLLDNSRHQEVANNIFKFLGLESCKVRSEFKRVTTEKLEDLILNYDEVYNFFKDTKYSNFLISQ